MLTAAMRRSQAQLQGRVLRAILVALFLLLTAATPRAQAQSGVVAIIAGQLVDVRAGRMLPSQVILIEGDRILAVGPSASVPIPSGAKRIDLSESTVLPGLIDAHTHLSGDPTIPYYDLYAVSFPRETVIGVMNARRTLLAGFTTIRNLGAQGFSDVAVRDGVARGDIPGPHIVASGPPLSVTGGDCDDNHLAPHYEAVTEGVADGPDALRAMVRRNIKYGADVIKVCAGGGLREGESGSPQFTQVELDAIVDEAHAAGRRVAIHAHGREPILRALRAGADTIEHATFADDEAIKLARARGAAFAIDVYKNAYLIEQAVRDGAPPPILAEMRRQAAAQADTLRRARLAGVRLIYATDAGVFPSGDNARQFETLSQFGVPMADALRMATLDAALALGLRETGLVAPGYAADLIAVRGDPLRDPRVLASPLFVMKSGVVYRGASDVCQAAPAPYPCVPPAQAD